MKKIVAVLFIVTILLTGCSNLGLNANNVQIDWVDFMIVNGIHYMADYQESDIESTTVEIGDVYSVVKFKVSENVHDPSYKSKEGDAAFLEAGTKIYSLKNYTPSTRLAVYVDDKIKIYDASMNIEGLKGEDLHDIRGKVQFIDGVLEDEKGNSTAFEIKDLSKINKLVDLMMDAGIDYNKQFKEGERYFIYFRMMDNTMLRKTYFINDNAMFPGIILAEDFKDTFLEALE